MLGMKKTLSLTLFIQDCSRAERDVIHQVLCPRAEEYAPQTLAIVHR